MFVFILTIIVMAKDPVCGMFVEETLFILNYISSYCNKLF